MKSRKFETKQGASYSEFQRLVVQLGISLSYMDHNISLQFTLCILVLLK